MAKEPERKDERKERAKTMYDNDRSVAMRGEPRKETAAKVDAKVESDKPETKPDDKTEGGEPRREPGEAKPRTASATEGGRRAEREAMHLRHEGERMKLHGDQRTEHRTMHEQHEKEMKALHA